MNLQSIGDAPAIESTAGCVVYSPDTGQIAHVHHLIRLCGADAVSKDAIERSALDMAGKHHDVSKLRIIHVTSEQLEKLNSETEFMVDVSKQQLVEGSGTPPMSSP